MRRLAGGFATALTMAVLGGAAVPPAIAAQGTREGWPHIRSLRPGDTVRVWALRPPLSGTVAEIIRLEGDTLTLREVPGRRTLPGRADVALRSLTRLDVQRGHRRSAGWTLVGVALGVAGGALVGSFTGVALECGSSCADDGELGGLVGVVVGGGVGAIAGAVAGGVLGGRRRPRWQPVGLPRG